MRVGRVMITFDRFRSSYRARPFAWLLLFGVVVTAGFTVTRAPFAVAGESAGYPSGDVVQPVDLDIPLMLDYLSRIRGTKHVQYAEPLRPSPLFFGIKTYASDLELAETWLSVLGLALDAREGRLSLREKGPGEPAVSRRARGMIIRKNAGATVRSVRGRYSDLDPVTVADAVDLMRDWIGGCEIHVEPEAYRRLGYADQITWKRTVDITLTDPAVLEAELMRFNHERGIEVSTEGETLTVRVRDWRRFTNAP